MRIKKIHLQDIRRFTDLTIEDIPESTRLVIVAGPNGCGKSSLFDSFKLWSQMYGLESAGLDDLYHRKIGTGNLDWGQLASIDFHGAVPVSDHEKKKIFYIRSAYRNESDFTTHSVGRMGSIFDAPKVEKLIENDARVSDNYQRFVSQTFDALYAGKHDQLSVGDLGKEFIGEISDSMQRVFSDLSLVGPGNPMEAGSFYFEKGVSRNFHYKNLSGGEKATFDLLLDFHTKRTGYDNTVFCIDEPELHMHTKLQAKLLEELYSLISDNSQLWIATHSIGMMRKARDLQCNNPDSVVFLDFDGRDFDKPTTITPKRVNRTFWRKTLSVALDDLADLVAPSKVVICEGKPADGGATARTEFDARCYRSIFSDEFPDVDFLSAGNANDVETDALRLTGVLKTISPGTEEIRVIDRDNQSVQEVDDHQSAGIRVLSLRNLESYLLDDEVLTVLCNEQGQEDKLQDVLDAKLKALENSVSRNNAPDDLKSAAGELYTEIKRILSLTDCGDKTDTFLRDTLAPLVPKAGTIYNTLKNDIFGT